MNGTLSKGIGHKSSRQWPKEWPVLPCFSFVLRTPYSTKIHFRCSWSLEYKLRAGFELAFLVRKWYKDNLSVRFEWHLCLPAIQFEYFQKDGMLEPNSVQWCPRELHQGKLWLTESWVGNIWFLSPLVLSKWEDLAFSVCIKVCLFFSFWMLKCTNVFNKT